MESVIAFKRLDNLGTSSKIPDQELSLAMMDAILSYNYILLHSLIQNVSSGRRVFKDLCNGVENVLIGNDVWEILLQVEEWDLAFCLAVSKGLWDKVVALYDHQHVLPRSRHQALKTAVKQGAWDAVQTLVASHTTSHTHRRHAFLAAVRHNRFDVATLLCQTDTDICPGDFKYAVKMFFAAENHTSQAGTRCQHLQTLCLQFIRNCELIRFVFREAFNHRCPHLVWRIVDDLSEHPPFSCAHSLHTDPLKLGMEIAVKAGCWEFVQKAVTCERVSWIKYFLEENALLNKRRFWPFLIPVLDTLTKKSPDPDYITVMISVYLPQISQQRLCQWCVRNSCWYFGLCLALRQKDNKTVVRILCSLEALFTEAWDDLLVDSTMCTAMWKSKITWKVLAPAIERMAKTASVEGEQDYVVRKIKSTVGQQARKILKWCCENAFSYTSLCVALAIKDSKKVLRILQSMDTPLPHTWDDMIFSATLDKATWKNKKNWRILVPIAERRVLEFDEYYDDLSYEVEAFGNTIKAVAPEVTDKLKKWCCAHSYTYLALCLATADKDVETVMRIVHKMKPALSEAWDDLVLESVVDSSVWQSEKNWQVLIPTLEKKIVANDYGDTDFMDTVIRQGTGVLARLENWCFDHSHCSVGICLTLASGTKSWQQIEELVNDMDIPSVGAMLYSFQAAVEKEAFSLALACVKRIPTHLFFHLHPFRFTDHASLIPLFDFCRSEGLKEWVVNLAVFFRQWDVVDFEMDTCDDDLLRSAVLEKAQSCNEWSTIQKLLPRCTGQEASLRGILRSAVRSGKAECARILFSLVGPASDCHYDLPLLSLAIDCFGDTMPETLAVCIQAGLSIQQNDQNNDKYFSPLRRAILLSSSLRLSVVRALFESGACTHKQLLSLKEPRPFTFVRQCPVDVLEFVEEVAHSPRSLQNQCRLLISHLIGCRSGRQKKIASLPLPVPVRDYLMFCDVEDQLTQHQDK